MPSDDQSGPCHGGSTTASGPWTAIGPDGTTFSGQVDRPVPRHDTPPDRPFKVEVETDGERRRVNRRAEAEPARGRYRRPSRSPRRQPSTKPECTAPGLPLR